MTGVPHHTTERRPIPARNWRIVQRFSAWIARRGVAPDAISIAGMICGIGAGVALGLTARAPAFGRAAWLIAAALILLRALANVLDGMVAIEAGRASPLGPLYNEVPDRVSDAAMLIGLGYAGGGDEVLGYAAAGAALLVAYVRALGGGVGVHQEFGGPMAKQQRMFTVVAVGAYLGLAPQRWQPGWGPPPTHGLATAALVVIIAGCLWTFVWRLRRIASALRARGA